jgi:hypothetical protein
VPDAPRKQKNSDKKKAGDTDENGPFAKSPRRLFGAEDFDAFRLLT